MTVLWEFLNAQAGWLFVLGLAVVALSNARRWKQDRQLAQQLHLATRHVGGVSDAAYVNMGKGAAANVLAVIEERASTAA